MNRTLRITAISAMLLSVLPALRGQFTEPTPQELSMTSLPQVPNAPAVYLFKEETTDDQYRMFSFYVRLKVLTDGGKEYANVELPYSSGVGASVDSISGRTIQPDGTIVPFTGKPYEKLLERGQGYTSKAKVFTLPAVQVGSILEYRYKLHYDDAYFQSPQWYIQSPLYMVKGHYSWRPTGSTVVTSDDRGEVLNSIAWTPILPVGAAVKQSSVAGNALGANTGNMGGGTQLDLVVNDIPPLPEEPYMPPVNSLSYRVLFYYTSYKTPLEFWTREGKRWSKERDKFATPGPGVNAEVSSLIAPGDTQEVKLKKLYDFVMTLENTDFSRRRDEQEDRAAGFKKPTSADDILARKRGEGDQLAELFVSMARAAGMKAYVMGVSNRSERLFLPSYLSLGQLEDLIAIVPLNGVDAYFDPGQRYCTFKHLAWQHTLTGGLRQSDDGAKLASTPSEAFTASTTKRIGDLTLDDKGVASGTVALSFTGNPALRWRHQALRGDDTSLNNQLRQMLERELPGGMEVRVTSTEALADPDKPLVIRYDIKGPIGSSTGKRVLIPVSPFEVNSKPLFTQAKRELVVDMGYPEMMQDAVRIKYPEGLTVESAPAEASDKLKNEAGYSFSSQAAPNEITLFRNVTVAKTFFQPEEYPELKAFYGKLDSAQGETLILTRSPAPAAPGGN